MNNQDILKNLLIDLKNILTLNDIIFYKNLSIKNDLFVSNNVSIGDYNPDFSIFTNGDAKIEKDLYVNGNLFVKNIIASDTIKDNFIKIENKQNQNSGFIFYFPDNLSISLHYDFQNNALKTYNSKNNLPIDLTIKNIYSNEIITNKIYSNNNHIEFNSNLIFNSDIYLNGYIKSNNEKIYIDSSIESNHKLFYNQIESNNLIIKNSLKSIITHTEQLFSTYSSIETINSSQINVKDINCENEIIVNLITNELIKTNEIQTNYIFTNKIIFNNNDELPITFSNKTFIPNLNAEFLNGKTAPNTDIVGIDDEQILKNKSFCNDINMYDNRIKNVKDPIDEYDVVNKKYVDMKINGINYFPFTKYGFNKLNENFIFDNDNLIIKNEDLILDTNDRILIFNINDENNNGIYIFNNKIENEYNFIKDSDYKKVINSRKYYHIFIEDGEYSGITIMIYFNIRKTQFSIIHNHNTFGYLMNKIIELEKKLS
jgi:hypothetical protein